ncbi:NAD(P)-binding protein [Paxillus ammoniavirescens]|nr:NAD(P)-binding protein [Paxillus ammoniavirescens]
MSTKTQVFITGATGYIGGAVLARLLEHPTFPTSEITALVRKADKIPAFDSIGVNTVLGSHNDLELLEKRASQSDVIFACADADNVSACEAILKGLKKRHQTTGTVPILIHTVSVLTDNAGGMHEYDTIWDDMNPDQLETLPDTQIHRNVDLMVIAADKEGYARTYIVLPSTIYGFATGKLVDLDIQNTRSIQIPMLVDASIARRRGGMVGEGLNRWPNVHIDDLADLYIVLYDAIRDGRAGHGREGLYFGENGEHRMRDVAASMADALHDLGVSDSREPTSFDEQDYGRPGARFLPYLGTNSRCKANRARTLGWKPKYTTEDMLKSIKGEVEWQLKHKA